MMLENNLHPDVAENPAELIVYGGIGKAARNRASLRRDPPRAGAAGRRADAARAVGQAGGGVRDARWRAASADREHEPGAGLGDVGGVPRLEGRADRCTAR